MGGLPHQASETLVKEKKGEWRRLGLSGGLRGCSHDPDCCPTGPSLCLAAGPALPGTDKSLGSDHCPGSGSTPNTWPAGQPGQGQIRVSRASGAQTAEHSWERRGTGGDQMMERAPWWHSTAAVYRPPHPQSCAVSSLMLPKPLCEVGNVTRSILQVKRLRFREVYLLQFPTMWVSGYPIKPWPT